MVCCKHHCVIAHGWDAGFAVTLWCSVAWLGVGSANVVLLTFIPFTKTRILDPLHAPSLPANILAILSTAGLYHISDFVPLHFISFCASSSICPSRSCLIPWPTSNSLFALGLLWISSQPHFSLGIRISITFYLSDWNHFLICIPASFYYHSHTF